MGLGRLKAEDTRPLVLGRSQRQHSSECIWLCEYLSSWHQGGRTSSLEPQRQRRVRNKRQLSSELYRRETEHKVAVYEPSRAYAQP